MPGKPQTLTAGQRQEVSVILRRQFIAGFTISLALLTGITGLSLWGVKQRVEGKVEELVAAQFEEPRIREIVQTVAVDRAGSMMEKQINPEVSRFKVEVQNQLNQLQALVQRTHELEAEIAKTAEIARPPSLNLTGRNVEEVKAGYKITLQFNPTKNVPLGAIVFVAVLPAPSHARIVDFWPAGGLPFVGGDGSKKIEDDGKHARLQYALLGPGAPSIALTVSEKTEFAIHGNYLEHPMSFNKDLDAEPAPPAKPSQSSGR